MNLGTKVHGEGQFPRLFRVDENLDVFADSILLVNNPEAETRVSVIEIQEQLGYRLPPQFDHAQARSVGSQGAGYVYLHLWPS
jgi:hypothetical protein